MSISSRSGFITRALFCIALWTGCSTSFAARPEYFRFTSIADTSEHFFSHLNFPCLNDLSRIAFTGTLSSGVEGAFSRVNLGGFNTLVDSGSTEFQDFGLDCSINHNAMIEFGALKKVSDGFDSIILRGTGNSSSPLIDSTGTFDQFLGFQLNIVGKSALGARRASDGASVILVKGAGTLNGPERIIAPGTGAIAQFSNFATNPVINSSGTVAFAATKNQNGTIHILTVTEAGLVTELLNDQGPFVGVGDVIINDTGSLAFHGTLAGGETGVWRIDQVNGSSTLTQLASSNNTPCVDFDAVAMNDLDAVTFACRDFSSSSYVYLSDSQGLHLILGPGSQLLGRRVARANIGREAVNSDKHVAILADFDDGSSAIVRADPTFIPPWLFPIFSGALQLEVVADESGSGGTGVSTSVVMRPKLLLLSFDIVSTGKPNGELRVMLGDTLLKSIASSGGRQHIVVPMDLRKDSRRKNASVDRLRFELAGKSGAAVQISNVQIPGVIADSMQSNVSARWHIDTAKGGHAYFVDTTPYPVQVQILDGKSATRQGSIATVAILSSDGFDVTHDIDRSTLRINGMLSDAGSASHSGCVAHDVNADKFPDLVCEVPTMATKSAKNSVIRVEAVSIHGWNVAGSSAVSNTAF